MQKAMHGPHPAAAIPVLVTCCCSNQVRAGRAPCPPCSRLACPWSNRWTRWRRLGNAVFAETTEAIQRDVSTGSALTHCHDHDGHLPDHGASNGLPLVRNRARWTTCSARATEFYEDEVDEAVKALSSLMEPFIIVILGGLIGGIVVSMAHAHLQARPGRLMLGLNEAELAFGCHPGCSASSACASAASSTSLRTACLQMMERRWLADCAEHLSDPESVAKVSGAGKAGGREARRSGQAHHRSDREAARWALQRRVRVARHCGCHQLRWHENLPLSAGCAWVQASAPPGNHFRCAIRSWKPPPARPSPPWLGRWGRSPRCCSGAALGRPAGAVLDRLGHHAAARRHQPAAALGRAAERLAGWTIPLQQSLIGALAGYLSLWSVYWVFKIVTGKGRHELATSSCWRPGRLAGLADAAADRAQEPRPSALVGIIAKLNAKLREGAMCPSGPSWRVAGWSSCAGRHVLGWMGWA